METAFGITVTDRRNIGQQEPQMLLNARVYHNMVSSENRNSAT